jgi:hypothetical protein
MSLVSCSPSDTLLTDFGDNWMTISHIGIPPWWETTRGLLLSCSARLGLMTDDDIDDRRLITFDSI